MWGLVALIEGVLAGGLILFGAACVIFHEQFPQTAASIIRLLFARLISQDPKRIRYDSSRWAWLRDDEGVERAPLRWPAPPAVVGVIALTLGLLLGASLIYRDVPLHNPLGVPAARQSFAQVAGPGGSGEAFQAVLSGFVEDRRRRVGSVEISGVEFIPFGERTVCQWQAPVCVEGRADRPVASWVGQLRWRERRDSGDQWSERACQADATLTTAAGWELNRSQWCYQRV